MAVLGRVNRPSFAAPHDLTDTDTAIHVNSVLGLLLAA